MRDYDYENFGIKEMEERIRIDEIEKRLEYEN